MKFVLFVEGVTERKGLPEFLKRWLDPRLSAPIGIRIVKFQGSPAYYEEITTRVDLAFAGKAGADIMAAIGLLDLYGLSFCPADRKTAEARKIWAKEHLEKKVGHPNFRQHFAVHETEAWLLAHPENLPPEVQKALPGKTARPET